MVAAAKKDRIEAEEAQANADQLGGHLVTINDVAENVWLFNQFTGQGVGVNDPLLQMSQGSLRTTNGALDLAVTGLGFFPVVHEKTLETPF